MPILRRIGLFLNRLLMILGGLCVLVLMFVAVANVIFRIAQVPFEGAYELVGFSGSLVIAFALAETQRRKDHVMVDVLTRRFPPVVIRIIDGFKYLACMIFFGVVARQVFLWGLNIKRTGEVSETLKLAYYPVVYGVALGFAALAVTLLIDFVGVFRKAGKGKASS